MHDPARLRRLLDPRTVAIVGASDAQPRTHSAIQAMAETGIELFLVNPNRPEVAGRRAWPSLEAIGRPVDAVFAMVGAQAAIEVVRQAAAAGAGGTVVNAGGFKEAGAAGAELERQLVTAAGVMPLLGPNCNGFVNARSGARLSGLPLLPLQAGRAAFVTHSGGMMGSLGIAGVQRGFGFSWLLSTGNEAALDMADCIRFLADDAETQVICLAVETLRRGERFFDAVACARAAGKPVIALKLGRSRRGQEIASSHTGALAGEHWMYEAAFRQHGIAIARDLEDLADQAMLFAQLPRSRWPAARGVALATLSGGSATLASDVAEDEGVAMPELAGLRGDIAAFIPGVQTVNPLDMTGLAMSRPELGDAALRALAGAVEVDTLVGQWFVDQEALAPGQTLIATARQLARDSGKAVIIASLEDGCIGEWATEALQDGVGLGRGLRATFRALRAMREFAEQPPAVPAGMQPTIGAHRVPATSVVASAAGPMLSFGAAMDLLAQTGIPVAPFVLLGPADDLPTALPFAAPYVAKLADVPHRTDIGAVRLGLQPHQLRDAVGELRALAGRLGLPAAVAIQPMVRLEGEAFIGVKVDPALGPMVLFGLGGILVEALRQIAGRLAPLGPQDAAAMLAQFDASGVLDGLRGQRPWPREQLVALLQRVSALAAAARPWLTSLDINPLGLGPDGFVAVDALFLLQPDAAGNAP